MNGSEMKRLRERAQFTQGELAKLLNEALGKKYSDSSVSKWEIGKVPIPAHVEAMVASLAASVGLGLDDLTAEARTEMGAPDGARVDDTSPPDPQAGLFQPGTAPLMTSGAYSKMCAELFEIIATGIGMTGAAIGSTKLMQDGAIIDADKERLGEAWGKLAETNASFRNMLFGLQSGGAWMQVAIVTGSTVGKCWQNHAQPLEGGGYGATGNGHLPDGPASQPDQAAA